jgi:hypothetical protein
LQPDFCGAAGATSPPRILQNGFRGEYAEKQRPLKLLKIRRLRRKIINPA